MPFLGGADGSSCVCLSQLSAGFVGGPALSQLDGGFISPEKSEKP
jgi:hypothetical protein